MCVIITTSIATVPSASIHSINTTTFGIAQLSSQLILASCCNNGGFVVNDTNRCYSKREKKKKNESMQKRSRNLCESLLRSHKLDLTRIIRFPFFNSLNSSNNNNKNNNNSDNCCRSLVILFVPDFCSLSNVYTWHLLCLMISAKIRYYRSINILIWASLFGVKEVNWQQSQSGI